MPTSHGVQLNGTEDKIVPYAFPGLIDDGEEVYVDPEDDKSHFQRDIFANVSPPPLPTEASSRSTCTP
jgi:hypothetical protein